MFHENHSGSNIQRTIQKECHCSGWHPQATAMPQENMFNPWVSHQERWVVQLATAADGLIVDKACKSWHYIGHTNNFYHNTITIRHIYLADWWETCIVMHAYTTKLPCLWRTAFFAPFHFSHTLHSLWNNHHHHVVQLWYHTLVSKERQGRGGHCETAFCKESLMLIAHSP